MMVGLNQICAAIEKAINLSEKGTPSDKEWANRYLTQFKTLLNRLGFGSLETKLEVVSNSTGLQPVGAIAFSTSDSQNPPETVNLVPSDQQVFDFLHSK